MATSSLIAAGPAVTIEPRVARVLTTFDRETLASFITIAIELVDTIDGDPDDEPAGDDEPAESAGDDEPAGDEEDGAWVEWTTMRGSQKGGTNILPTSNEDDEDDDPDHGLDEGEPNYATVRDLTGAAGCSIADPGGCEHDGREHEEGVLVPSYRMDQAEGPLPEDPRADRALMRPHLERIRRTRCDRKEIRGTGGSLLAVDYRLKTTEN